MKNHQYWREIRHKKTT